MEKYDPDLGYNFVSDGNHVQQSEINGIRSNHEETDSRIVVYLLYQNKSSKQLLSERPTQISALFFYITHKVLFPYKSYPIQGMVKIRDLSILVTSPRS